jgi:hypothetical protein
MDTEQESEYMAALFTPNVLKKMRANFFIGALIIFFVLHFSHTTSNNGAEYDKMWWAAKVIFPLFFVALVGARAHKHKLHAHLHNFSPPFFL